jgi:hypothetical protein
MKGVIELLGITIGFIGMRLVAISWWLFKVFIGACVILGAFGQLGKEFTLSDYELMAWHETIWESILSFGIMVMGNWSEFAIIMLFLWMIYSKKEVEEISSHVYHLKLGVVTILNYLEIGPETIGMKEMHERGWIQIWKDSWNKHIAAIFLGSNIIPDDSLTAKPVRHGVNVGILGDLKSMKKDS